ncbi:MAG: LysR substrate-binding domain-containing protein [Oscillospiraceae bacterium]
MDLRKLQTFIRVVEAGNFSKAEEVTYTSRQALKKQVDALERDLEFKLLSRNSKGVSLTPAGREFYNGILKILADWEELAERCRGIANNEFVIRIANPAHPRLMLEPVFLEFSKRYPDIRQEFVYLNREELIDAILNGMVDIAELIPPRKVDLSKINYYKLKDMQYFCLLANSHPLAGRERLELEDLSGCFIGLRGHGNLELIQQIKERCSDISLVETMGSDVHNMFKFCYNHGIYISRANFMAEMEPLVAIPLVTDIQSECGILYPKDHSPIVGNFLEVVKDLFPPDL